MSTVKFPSLVKQVANWRRAGVIVILLLAIAVTASFPATPAAAADRRAVCSDTLYVRDDQMRVIGTLFRGQTFDVYRGAANGTVYGFAYGYVNHVGYVWPQYLC